MTIIDKYKFQSTFKSTLILALQSKQGAYSVTPPPPKKKDVLRIKSWLLLN
jgi:hypothetical protein